MKRILLLATTTGYQAGEFRRAADKLGVPLVLASDRCHVLDDPWRDGAIPVRIEDPEDSARRIVEFARHTPVAGVAAIGDPVTRIAALVCRELGIDFHSPEAVEAGRNKFLARERYRAAGLPTPWFARFRAREEPPESVPFPCVLKPLGLAASRGVIRADNRAEFLAAFRRIRALLESGDVRKMKDETSEWILAEGFIPGREVAVEALMTRGSLRTLAIFDKPDPLDGPYFEETIYVTPPRTELPVEEAIRVTLAQAVRAVGLSHGPLHAEMRINPDGIWMLEMAPRPIGGLCARTLRFSDGVSLEELILRHALGEPVDHLERERAASGVMMIPIPSEGVLDAVEDLGPASATPGVEQIEITAKLGQKLIPLPEGSSYLGFIFARGQSPEDVEKSLREAHRKLRFEISVSLPVV